MKAKLKLWKILVPASGNNGKDFTYEHHKAWDAFVRSLTGGVTILKTAKGQWVSPNGQLYNDRMIPCEINCTKRQIIEIALFTKKHYEQEAVAYYKISGGMHII